MTQSDNKATLSFSDGSPSLDFPIYKVTIGPDRSIAATSRPGGTSMSGCSGPTAAGGAAPSLAAVHG